MKVSKELLEKAGTARTAEELCGMAEKEGISLTPEQAEQVFACLRRAGEVADEELDNVAGGGCGGKKKESDTPEYKVGDKVSYINFVPGRITQSKIDAVVLEVLDKKYGNFYYKVTGNITKMESELFRVD